LIARANNLKWSGWEMHDRPMKTDRRNWRQLVVALLLFWGGLPARANVYATNIKLNGSTNNAAVSTNNAAVQISYILNDTATSVSVRIFSGASLIWSNSVTGTNAGSNSMVWGGTNQAGQNVAEGVYQVSITAASTGYAAWTNITDDSANFQVFMPSGIDVNKNTNSPYYGRVFVGNAPKVSGAGIYKFNPDGSPADEGVFSTGSYDWAGGVSGYAPGFLYSPWEIAIAQDDTVYINDWSGDGLVLAFDEVISTNYLTVLDSDNYPIQDLNVQFSGPCVTGVGAGTQIWMADANVNGSSVGVVRYNVTANGAVADDDPGTVVVGISPTGLNLGAHNVAVDASSNIYVIQSLDGFLNPGDYYSMPRVLCFPPYGGEADLLTNWSISSEDYSLENAAGIAVDPTATWVAVAVRGYDDGIHDAENGDFLSDGVVGHLENGSVNIYYATNGALVTRLGAGTNDQFVDVAWDTAGNLYATDLSAEVWRAYSPPGTNQAATIALPIIQVYDTLIQPRLCACAAPAGQFGFALHGQSSVTYVIECSPDLINWTPIATNYDIVPRRVFCVPGTNSASFFQAVVPP
jgi:hypothetical protein